MIMSVRLTQLFLSNYTRTKLVDNLLLIQSRLEGTRTAVVKQLITNPIVCKTLCKMHRLHARQIKGR